MKEVPGFDMYVFRDGRTPLGTRALLSDLATELRALAGGLPDGASRRQMVIRALLHAGELECIAADEGAGCRAVVAQVTDALADTLLGGETALGAWVFDHLAQVDLPAIVSATRPEGFAYYAVHPLQFAHVAEQLPLPGREIAVVGIRSIGTTLGAVVAAALRRRDAAVDRLTVRPSGHPYERVLTPTAEARRWIERRRAAGATFLVVDEGPGLSGSSFLSVAEALVDAGVPHDRVVLICSRAPRPDVLLAPDASRRARLFRWVETAPAARAPQGEFLGGGAWRGRVYRDPAAWPACWATLERPKYLTPDGGRLLKFEGLGGYGDDVRQRAQGLADAGFAPAPRDEGDGFVSYPWLAGRPLSPSDLWRGALERLAEYCAFRASAFPAARHEPIDPMVHANFTAEFGVELPRSVVLHVERPVVTDGRMMPHEWLLTSHGDLLKLDGATHGDDHFFPGPTDIAWDLAGAIVEWRMDPEARRLFLDRYRRASGDRPDGRIDGYVLAYTLFRLAYTSMAAHAMRGSDEEQRLAAEHTRYRDLLLEADVPVRVPNPTPTPRGGPGGRR